MRYRIVAVGKLRRKFYQQGCAYFGERLARLAQVSVVEVKEGRGATAEEVKAAEGKALLAQASGRLVALDERGRSWRSSELASHVADLDLRGESELTLLIGGAEGLSAEVRAAVQESWRLSELTLPHDLARLVLLEQLYRIESIRANHPYHRE